MNRKMLNDINRSIPSLSLDSGVMDGFYTRLVKQYGMQNVARVVAADAKKSPSPTLDVPIREWASKTATGDGADMPFWVMKNLAFRIMKEGNGPRLAAKNPSPLVKRKSDHI